MSLNFEVMFLYLFTLGNRHTTENRWGGKW